MGDDRMTIDPDAQEDGESRGRDRGEIRSTIIKLVVASLIVGLIMKWSGFTPLSLLEFLGDSFRDIFANLGSVVSTIAEWLLLGATIVVPVWLAMRLLGGGRRD